MAVIAIYFDEPGKLDYPLNHQIYFDSYRDFSQLAQSEGHRVYIVRGTESYLGAMRFASGWEFQGEDLVEIPEEIAADIIYQKGLGPTLAIGPGDRILNDPEFDEFCGDKWRTYQKLGRFMAPTFLINRENWQEVMSNISTEKVVIKPNTGAGGKDISIVETASFNPDQFDLESEQFLAQDFVDTSRGIKGLCDSYHDLRIVMFNHEPSFSYLRMPKPGDLRSNLSQGGSAQALEIEEIPRSILEIAREIDTHFTQYSPRVYTIDFMVEDGRPVLGELNRRPGFPHPSNEGERITREFHRKLLDTLVGAVHTQS